MGYIVSADVIEKLWEALIAPLNGQDMRAAEREMLGVVKAGWATSTDIEDVFFYADPRLDHRDIFDPLCAALKLPWRSVFDRPRARSNSVSGYEALEVWDFAELLISLEKLGFAIDPSPVVTALRPSLSRKRRITNAELSVLWFERMRHKGGHFTLQVNERAAGCRRQEHHVTTTGYRVELWRDAEDRPLLLEVTAPKHRHVRGPVKTVCPDCGHTWYRGDVDSSASHRRIHAKRMAILDPQPSSEMLARRMTSDDAELVMPDAPKWMQRAMYDRAVAFKREMGFDFVQWTIAADDPSAHGFLFTDPGGAIVGACAFRLRKRDHGDRWGLQWIWVCPRARRSGVLAARWKRLRHLFGDFHVEGPVSDAMVAFLSKHQEAALLDRIESPLLGSASRS